MKFLKNLGSRLVEAVDSDYFPAGAETVRSQPERLEIPRLVPFIILHLGCIGVIWTGWSWAAVIVAATLYVIRMFAITAFYHRYFCHRAYKTSRAAQFLFALVGLTAVQRGPLWWAAVHRHHHAHSDDDSDAHSPVQKGFLWSHVGWLTSSRNFPTDYRIVRDLMRYPELHFLNRFDLIGPLLLLVLLYALGSALEAFAPGLGTSGWQMVVWGFFISTTVLFHATCAVNSFAHTLGTKRFPTGDESRNSLLLALFTLGEGWHNNHHHYQSSARQGFYWWEIDISYYMLRALAALGIVWDLREVPEQVYTQTDAKVRS
ncbi:MAG: acyl-CoA desaturase [Verrucomicrobia bacterium 61-8]|nr:acyl-CoA desaturase [Verrucomicrobiota bacterium]OJV26183.1 MAG: acyl-CoA desaturase [Verrucomicrobia bacterium 61-8]